MQEIQIQLPKSAALFWNGKLSNLAKTGQVSQMEATFIEMIRHATPNEVTCSLMLDVYANRGEIEKIQDLFQKMPEFGVVANQIHHNIRLGAYRSQGMDKILSAFNDMKLKHQVDVTSYNIMMNALINVRRDAEAKDLFRELVESGLQPTVVTFNILLGSKSGHQEFAQEMQRLGISLNSITYQKIIENLCAIGRFSKAKELLRRMEEQGLKDVQPYNTILAAHSASGRTMKEAEEFFCMMKEKNLVNEHSWSSFLYVAAAKGRTQVLKSTMKNLRDQNQATVYIYNWLLKGLAKMRNSVPVAKSYLLSMSRNHIEKNEFTWQAALEVGAANGDVDFVKSIRDQVNMLKLCYANFNNDLMDAFIKAGSPSDAINLFDSLSVEERDERVWTTLLTAYGNFRDVSQMEERFMEMQNAQIPATAYTLKKLLHAYSHVLEVDKIIDLHSKMQEKFGISPNSQHDGIVADALSRSNRIEEAIQFIDPANVIHWMTILGACRKHLDEEHGKLAFEKIKELDPENVASYILMSNIYSKLDKKKEAAAILQSVKALGLKKIAGESWITLNGEQHFFTAHDQTNPLMSKILEFTQDSLKKMKEEGFASDLSWVTKDIEEEAKENDLCGHSERSAASLGIMKTDPKTPLVIFKNLRVCGDCHVYTAMLSKIYDREIRLRDTAVWHIFKNGECNCKGSY
eukprot:TRINITY_DN5039_c1_g1_i1.p1 TRINITY_DN5039_c1_g1~~TRINITY_DN5039_c1_g1_i1.p1  ORF type:complete len:688 (+),score=192.55 TRINITY_DN5039_c1_g1_i1:795-2858(+)